MNATEEYKGFLYNISLNGIHKGYILGSPGFVLDSEYKMSKIVDTAFSKSEFLVINMMPGGYKTELQEKYKNINVEKISENICKIYSKKAGFNTFSPEARLIQEADAKNKKILQLGNFDTLSEMISLIDKMVSKTILRQEEIEHERILQKKYIRAYKAGSEDFAEVLARENNSSVQNVMKNQNLALAKKADEYLKANTNLFFVIPIELLFGDNNFISNLKDRNWQIERQSI